MTSETPAKNHYPPVIYLDYSTRRWFVPGEKDEHGPIEGHGIRYECTGSVPSQTLPSVPPSSEGSQSPRDALEALENLTLRSALSAPPVSLPEGLDISDLFDALFVADKDFKTAPDHSPEEEEAYERRRALMRKIVEAARAPAPLGEAPKPEAPSTELHRLPAINRFGVDCEYFRKELTRLYHSLNNRPADELARYLRTLANAAEAHEPSPVVEPGPVYIVPVGAIDPDAIKEFQNHRAEIKLVPASGSARKIIQGLLDGINHWASEEDGIPDFCESAVVAAVDFLEGRGVVEPAPLVWTKEKPTREGMYWVRFHESGNVTTQSVFKHPSGVMAYRAWACDWAGPIPEPVESPTPLMKGGVVETGKGGQGG